MKKNNTIHGAVFNWRDKKILIVEDDYVNYLFFHEMLSCSFACLIRAVSVQEAFDMLTSGTTFDLLIINSCIPGNENCHAMKKIKLHWPMLPVIALSSCDAKEKLERCNPAGCDTIINRNIDSTDMRLLVNELFFPVN
jgi:two-component system cell cycle response regulator DivK